MINRTSGKHIGSLQWGTVWKTDMADAGNYFVLHQGSNALLKIWGCLDFVFNKSRGYEFCHTMQRKKYIIYVQNLFWEIILQEEFLTSDFQTKPKRTLKLQWHAVRTSLLSAMYGNDTSKLKYFHMNHSQLHKGHGQAGTSSYEKIRPSTLSRMQDKPWSESDRWYSFWGSKCFTHNVHQQLCNLYKRQSNLCGHDLGSRHNLHTALCTTVL